MEYDSLVRKAMAQRDRYTGTVTLLSDFIAHLLEKTPDLINRQQDIYLNIDDM